MNQAQLVRRRQLLGGGIAAVVAADQLTKLLAGRLGPGPLVLPLRNHGLSLQVVDTGRWLETTAMALGLLAAAVVLWPRARSARSVTGVALLLGGGASNIVDRAALGYVRDYLPVGPVVVNLADLAVLAGLLLLLWSSLRCRRTPDHGPAAPARRDPIRTPDATAEGR